MGTDQSLKYLIVVFDGLRPDHVTDSRMPNLSGLKRAGSWLTRHRAAFPTETRVNAASLATGAPCAEHGIVGNRFIDVGYDPSRLVDGGDLASLRALDAGAGRTAMTAAPFSEILAARRLPMISVGSQSSGSWGLTHPTVDADGHVGYWCADATLFTDNPTVAALAGEFPRFSADPPMAAESCGRVADAFLELVKSEPLPSVSLVWFGEPDVCYHNFGLGSPEAEDALMQADRSFGRLLDWWDCRRHEENLQLVVTSDHGHITISEQISVKETLRRAGFSVGSSFETGDEVALTGGRVSDVWVRDGDPALAGAVLDVLREQAWFGLSFSARGDGDFGVIPGTFSHDSVFAAHRRAPDLRVTFVDNDEDNAFGVPGCGYSDGRHPAGDSMHGGLHPRELRSVGLYAGSAFKSGHESDVPASITDVAPTIFHGLGIEKPVSMKGRVLHELFDADDASSLPVQRCPVALTAGARRSTIHRTRVGTHVYLDGAEYQEVENGGGGLRARG